MENSKVIKSLKVEKETLIVTNANLFFFYIY